MFLLAESVELPTMEPAMALSIVERSGPEKQGSGQGRRDLRQERGTSVVQWLRLHSHSRGPVLIPSQGTRPWLHCNEGPGANAWHLKTPPVPSKPDAAK